MPAEMLSRQETEYQEVGLTSLASGSEIVSSRILFSVKLEDELSPVISPWPEVNTRTHGQ